MSYFDSAGKALLNSRLTALGLTSATIYAASDGMNAPVGYSNPITAQPTIYAGYFDKGYVDGCLSNNGIEATFTYNTVTYPIGTPLIYLANLLAQTPTAGAGNMVAWNLMRQLNAASTTTFAIFSASDVTKFTTELTSLGFLATDQINAIIAVGAYPDPTWSATLYGQSDFATYFPGFTATVNGATLVNTCHPAFITEARS